MNNMQNIVKIQKPYLGFRDEAMVLGRTIKKFVKKNPKTKISIDFSNVRFFSRGFADELLNIIEKLPKNRVEIININPEMNLFIDTVKKQKIRTREELKTSA